MRRYFIKYTDEHLKCSFVHYEEPRVVIKDGFFISCAIKKNINIKTNGKKIKNQDIDVYPDVHK